MRIRKLLVGFAAIAMALMSVGSAMAVPPPNQAEFNLVVNAGSQLSVAITNSTNFVPVNFTLAGPANWTDSASYIMQVVDMRGTGFGWTVTGSATAFTPAIPGASLMHVNNTMWSGLCGSASFCASPGSISAGVGHFVTPPNVMAPAAAAIIMWSAAGQTSAPSPYGTGTFQMQNVVYYNGIPDALTVGNYSTTLTLTIASGFAP